MVLNRTIIIILLVASSKCVAQTAGEILAQKQTQIKYLTQQIAALQVYIGYAQKGYSIAKDGLHMISDIKKGDFSLHSGYFSSLKKINPNVSRYAKIADIISCNINMLKSYRSGFKRMKESGQFTGKEINYVHSVFDKVLNDASQIIEELIMLITPDGYEMKDDERLKRIDALYIRMLDNQTFVKYFSNENYVLSVLRKQEGNEVTTSQKIYNVK